MTDIDFNNPKAFATLKHRAEYGAAVAAAIDTGKPLRGKLAHYAVLCAHTLLPALCEIERLREAARVVPAPLGPVVIPMLLWCPKCGERHIDEGRWATHPHATHVCQSCGLPWKPALVPTVGVVFLPGHRTAESDR